MRWGWGRCQRAASLSLDGPAVRILPHSSYTRLELKPRNRVALKSECGLSTPLGGSVRACTAPDTESPVSRILKICESQSVEDVRIPPRLKLVKRLRIPPRLDLFPTLTPSLLFILSVWNRTGRTVNNKQRERCGRGVKPVLYTVRTWSTVRVYTGVSTHRPVIIFLGHSHKLLSKWTILLLLRSFSMNVSCFNSKSNFKLLFLKIKQPSL